MATFKTDGLRVGDLVKIYPNEDWGDDAKSQLRNKNLTIRSIVGGQLKFVELETPEGRKAAGISVDWGVDVKNVKKIEKYDNPIEAVISRIYKEMESTGLPIERLPSKEHLSSKITNEWLDKKKMKEWITCYVKNETPPPEENEKPTVRNIQLSEEPF